MRKEIKFDIQTILFYLILFGANIALWVNLFGGKMHLHSRIPILLLTLVTIVVIYLWARIGIWGLVGRPAIVLTDDYIRITTNGLMIRWKDIINMELKTSSGRGGPNYTIWLNINNYREYINELTDPLIRNYYLLSKSYDYPYEINLTELRGDKQALFELIEHYYFIYK